MDPILPNGCTPVASARPFGEWTRPSDRGVPSRNFWSDLISARSQPEISPRRGQFDVLGVYIPLRNGGLQPVDRSRRSVGGDESWGHTPMSGVWDAVSRCEDLSRSQIVVLQGAEGRHSFNLQYPRCPGRCSNRRRERESVRNRVE